MNLRHIGYEPIALSGLSYPARILIRLRDAQADDQFRIAGQRRDLVVVEVHVRDQGLIAGEETAGALAALLWFCLHDD